MVLLKQGQVISMLKFDTKGLANELLNNLKLEIQETFENDWEQNVVKFMNYGEFKTQADFKVEVRRYLNSIITYLEANTYVLADSYGTGSLMLLDNPGYRKYRNSDAWNKRRTSNTIVGREAGEYTDIFGKTHRTSGSKAGDPLEGVTVREGYKIQPVAPSRALEAAEGYMYRTYLPNAYKLAVQRTNFAKFLKES